MAVVAELTEHGISNAVKLENARQKSMLGQHSGRKCLVRVRDRFFLSIFSLQI